MDKWKDIELEKMKAGGNRKAREFFDSQDDYDDTMPISQKYNSRAAALYRDKISALAQGKDWDYKQALSDYKNSAKTSTSHSSLGMSHSKSTGALGNSSYQNGGGYQDSGYQNFNSPEFKNQTENFFSKIQNENASRPEWVL